MPAGNGTGPEGNGPMTGRGMGYCAGYPHAGYQYGGWGHRRWHAFGRGRGYRNRFFPGGYGFGRRYGPGYGYAAAPAQPPSPVEEEQVLSEQAAWLQDQLELIQERLKTIKDNKPTSEE